MARLKKLNSAAISKAKGRLSNLKAIDENLDLGNGLTVASYEAEITALEKKQSDYNNKLAEADELMEAFEDGETDMNSLSERMLEGVSTKFGKDSDEYETAGGTKKSERKKPVRKPKPTPA